MEVLVRLSSTREALADSQASLESSRTVDYGHRTAEPALLRQAGREAGQLRPPQSLRRRGHLRPRRTVACPTATTWDGEADQAEARRPRAWRPRSGSRTSAPAPTSTSSASPRHRRGLSGVLRFAARLRKVLENVETAGPRCRGLDLHRRCHPVGGTAPQRGGTSCAGSKAGARKPSRIGRAASSSALATASRREASTPSRPRARWTSTWRWR